MSGRSGKTLGPERERLILELLGNNARSISELSEKVGVSEATIRRDLDSLETQGLLKRVHGGAAISGPGRREPLFHEKTEIRAEEKKDIAAKALELIGDSETVFIDGGSTALALARLLDSKKNLIVVTNSLMAAAELMESPHKLIIVGGEFRALSRTLVGPLTSHIISSLRIDKAFLGTIGFTVEDGISTTDPAEAYTKELIMKRSAKVIVLADSGKIGVPSFARSGGISDINTLITDPGVTPAQVRELKKKNIEVIF